MAIGLKRRIEPRAFGLPYQHLATELQLSLAAIPLSCPYITWSSALQLSLHTINTITTINNTIQLPLYPPSLIPSPFLVAILQWPDKWSGKLSSHPWCSDIMMMREGMASRAHMYDK